MLSRDSNENGQKKSVDLISKKHLCTCSTLFSYISLPLFYTTTTWNFHKLLSYTLYGGNVVRVLAHFFFTAAHFHLAMVAAGISYFLTAATKLSCCSCNKKISPLFFSLALDLCRPFSRWTSLACRLLSRFLCLSLALFSNCLGMTIQLI